MTAVSRDLTAEELGAFMSGVDVPASWAHDRNMAVWRADNPCSCHAACECERELVPADVA